MRKLILCLLIFCCAIAYNTTAQQNLTRTLVHDGQTREYLVFIPASNTPEQPVPLVINLHGFGSTGSEQLFYGDFRPVADSANFIIVSPTGTLLGGETTHWNVGGWTSSSTTDDIGFIDALLDQLIADFNIDESRIYSTGMSNGGFMSFVLACQLSHRIAAIASVTGSMTIQTFNSCDPQHPMPVLQIHGTNDAVIPYDGGFGWNKPIDDVLDYWVNFNNCLRPAVEFGLANVNPSDQSVVERVAYNDGDNGVSTVHYRVVGGEHTWPGNVYNMSGVNKDINASQHIWAFFRQFDINGRRDLVTDLDESLNQMQIYPNPVKNELKIDLGENPTSDYFLHSATGQLLEQGFIQDGSKVIDFGERPSAIFFLTIGSKRFKILRGL